MSCHMGIMSVNCHRGEAMGVDERLRVRIILPLAEFWQHREAVQAHAFAAGNVYGYHSVRAWLDYLPIASAQRTPLHAQLAVAPVMTRWKLPKHPAPHCRDCSDYEAPLDGDGLCKRCALHRREIEATSEYTTADGTTTAAWWQAAVAVVRPQSDTAQKEPEPEPEPAA